MIRYQDLLSWCEMQDLQPPVSRRRGLVITTTEDRQFEVLQRMMAVGPLSRASGLDILVPYSCIREPPPAQTYSRAELHKWLSLNDLYEIRVDEEDRTVVWSPDAPQAAEMYRYLARCELIPHDEYNEARTTRGAWLTTVNWAEINRRAQPA